MFTEAVLQGLYSDFTLVINGKELLLHKCVLDSSTYFHNLFQDLNCNNQHLDKDHPKILENAIRSLYGEPYNSIECDYCDQQMEHKEMDYRIIYIEYCDEFMIPFPVELLHNIRVPKEKYQFLQRAVSLFSASKELNEVLQDNLPVDANLDLLPVHLKQVYSQRLYTKVSVKYGIKEINYGVLIQMTMQVLISHLQVDIY